MKKQQSIRVSPKTPERDSYFRLTRAFPLRRLNTPGQYAKAKQAYRRVSKKKTEPGAREYLISLADIIADYERQSEQDIDSRWAITVADLVRQRLEEKGVSITSIAKKLKMPQPHMSKMLTGRRTWSKPAIKLLSKMLHIRPERFLE
jgi:ribosome-binding protein aMBF1 (putative translation factor)